jgi:hypothetical protein
LGRASESLAAGLTGLPFSYTLIAAMEFAKTALSANDSCGKDDYLALSQARPRARMFKHGRQSQPAAEDMAQAKPSETALSKRVPPNYLRRIRASLALLDETMSQVAFWAEAGDKTDGLYRRVLDLSPEELASAVALAERIRAEISAIGGELALEPRVASARNVLGTAAMFGLIDLEEMGPKGLKGYGGVSEETMKYVQELLARLRAPLEELHSICFAQRDDEGEDRDGQK